jgi:ribulose 1,5-bisphosphate synthetase/thiazole synthase
LVSLAAHSPGIDGAVKEWAVDLSRNVVAVRRDEEERMSERESMAYDVVIVGAGPAGLSAAIRLKQLAAAAERDISVCILEKGSEVGAHILSGAVVDPKALDELIPDWRERGAPLTVPVTENHHWVLTKTGKWAMPHFALPPFMRNKGTYTLSLGNLCRWLAAQAEELGVEIFPGFPAAEVLFNEDGSVKGVATGDMGIARDGSHRADYQPGMELHAKYTFFAEGARGSLTKELSRLFGLRDKSGPQVSGLVSKSCGTFLPTNISPVESSTRRAGRSRTLGAGASSIIRKTTRSRSASSSRSTMRTRTFRRSRNSSGGRPIRLFAPRSRAAAASPMALAPSTRAAGRPFRNWLSRAAR